MNTNPSDAIQAGFKHAWKDLSGRLNAGIDHLTEMTVNSSNEANYNRLADKTAGVTAALTILEDLSASDIVKSGDYAGAWRTFTDQATSLLNSDGKSQGYYQGVHLALTYQRGYGADIDAPRIDNPHNH